MRVVNMPVLLVACFAVCVSGDIGLGPPPPEGDAPASEADMEAQFSGERTCGTNNYGGNCGQAWAKGSTNECFRQITNRGVWPLSAWGWTNRLTSSSEVMAVYHGSNPSDCSGGTHVADVLVETTGSDVTVTVTMKPGWTMRELKYYVGSSKLPIRFGWYKASPWYFANQRTSLGPFSCGRPLTTTYVAIYLEVCEDQCEPVGARTPKVKTITTNADWDGGSNSLPANQVSEGMLAWELDGNNAYLHNFPAVLLRSGVDAFFPEQQDAIPAGKKFRVKCPANCDDKPCEVIVTTYHCPPCSSNTNGRLPGTMPVSGWSPGHCAPRFRYFAEKFPMVGFRKLVAAGTTEDTPVFELPLSNVAVFVRQGALDCGGFMGSSACNAQAECQWDGDDAECKAVWCDPAAPGGPPECAQTCNAPTRAGMN
eukprot:TRINITY_DN324_c0_g1_i1.p1 TRINITY_DN324_c0_g1~~TRINITY_DN324_c0_g1_i1.p1  ORF type:complete len:424 (+),score=152.08 TRINITY_DN324_c0_g1_i1:68-1339(+)